MGYRHIDTANGYHNELIIGEALQEAFKNKLVTRDEIFVTSKLGPAEMDPPDVLPTLQASLRWPRAALYMFIMFYIMFYDKLSGNQPGSLMPKVLARVALHPLDSCFWKAFNDLMLWCNFTKWSNMLVAPRSVVSTQLNFWRFQ